MQSSGLHPTSHHDVGRGLGPQYPPSRDRPHPATSSSGKILQSLLYNFAQSNYLNNNNPWRMNGDALDHAAASSRSRSSVSITSASPEIPYPISPSSEMMYPQMRHPAYHQGHSPTTVGSHRGHSPSSAQSGPESGHHYSVTATVTSQTRSRDSTTMAMYPDNVETVRQRSGSIGSAGSSFRDSQSPSHESTTSHDSYSGCSPISMQSSPSPSPPTAESGSKLLGILKGNPYQYACGSMRSNSTASTRYNPVSSFSSTSGRVPPYLPATGHENGRLNHNFKADTVIRNKIRVPSESFTHRSPNPSPPPLLPIKREIGDCQDEPMDLSVKKPKCDLGLQTSNPQSVSSSIGWGSDYFYRSFSNGTPTEEDGSPRKTILESILCRNTSVPYMSRNSSPMSRSDLSSPSRDSVFRTPSDRGSPRKDDREYLPSDSPVIMSPLSYLSPSSNPPSPAHSTGSQFLTSAMKPRCPWRQRVTLAKKNLFPVSARVTDWLQKIADYARSLPEFASLPDADKVALIQQCWTRLMLLCMAENNFQFAVTPVHEDPDNGRPPAISGIDPTEPTMDSVEMVQNFIRKCQTLAVDSHEYNCLRVVTLFHPGCTGVENMDFVERISSKARHTLEEHVRRSCPTDKLRYSNLLLCLHTLFGVNCGMVQTLFCKHAAKDIDLDIYFRDMVLKWEGTYDDEESSNEDSIDDVSRVNGVTARAPCGDTYKPDDDITRADSCPK